MTVEDCEFAGLFTLDGAVVAGFQTHAANDQQQGIWLAPAALRQMLVQNPGHTELTRAFYALEKNALTGNPARSA